MRKIYLHLLSVLFPVLVITGLLLNSGRIWHGRHGEQRLNGCQGIMTEVADVVNKLEKGTADWPSWCGPDGNGRSPVTGIKKDWSDGLTKVWEVSFLCEGKRNVAWSTPAIRGNRLVVMGRDNKNDLVFCLAPESGEVIWKASYEVKAGTTRGRGARATPFIDGDRVYTFGRSGDLVCWHLEDGQPVWRQNVKQEGGREPTWGHSSSPLVYQDKVIVQGGGRALAAAYDKMTGDLAWKSMEGKAGYAAVVTIRAGDAHKLLIFSGTQLACLEPDTGGKIWSVPWETDYHVNAATPVSSGSTLLITSGYNTGCEAFRVEDTNVESLWRSKSLACHHSDLVIVDGYVYGYSGQSDVEEGLFMCVELNSGKERWSTDELAWGTVVYVDGHLLYMDIEGNLLLIRPDPDRFEKVTELEHALGDSGGNVCTKPVVANGRMYLRHAHRLLCYDLMPQ